MFILNLNKKAVSPVIGTVLLVALTISLVSVAAVIFFDFTQDIDEIIDSNVEITQEGEVHLIDKGNADKIMVQYPDREEHELSLGEIYTPSSTEYSIIAIKGENQMLLNNVNTDTVNSGTCDPENIEEIFNNMNGEGTESNPYKITNECELQSVNEDLNAHYVLENNIDASETKNWNDGDGFIPIGYTTDDVDDFDNEWFRGDFDGQGNEINGLYIDRSEPNSEWEEWTRYVGLFSLALDADINNVRLTDVNIKAEYTTGGLIGFSRNSPVSNIQLSGVIESKSGSYTGGVVGRTDSNVATIDDINLNINVNGIDRVGGVVGETRSNITNADVSGHVTGEGRVGGVVGNTRETSDEELTIDREISNVVSNVNVKGVDRVGGVVGHLTSSDGRFIVREGHSSGDIKSNIENVDYAESNVGNFGGIVGLISENENIYDSSYSGDIITKTNKVGGIAGFTNGDIVNSYNDGRLIITNSNDNTDHVYVGGVVGILKEGGNVIDSYSLGYIESSDKRVGGITGRSERNTKISNSHNEGNIKNKEGVIGGLVGSAAYNSEISDSYSTGNVESNLNEVGGLVGTLNVDAEISDSYSTGNIGTNGNKAGGLVGNIDGISDISNSYATGEVNIEGQYAGGLVGFADAADISNSYAKGDVTSERRSGGLIGRGNTVSVSESFATGDVTVNDISAGGLFGKLYPDSTVINSYATGDIIANDEDEGYAGGFIGYKHPDNTLVETSYSTGAVDSEGSFVGGFIGENNNDIINSYWDKESSMQSDGIGDGSGDVKGLLTSEMQGVDAEDNMPEFDFNNIWNIVTNPDGYPVLRGSGTLTSESNSDEPNCSEIDYDTFDDEYNKITNDYELQCIKEDLSGNYRLGNNIDAGGTENWNDGDGFIPIGNRDEEFGGEFDGNEYDISDLYVDRDNPINNENWVGSVGLFGATSDANIENINLINIDITGEYETGGLIGFVIDSNIENIYVQGSIESTTGDATGGIIARTNDYDTIVKNTTTNADILGIDEVGGVIGDSKSSVYNADVIGTISGTNEVGGITGSTQYNNAEDVGAIKNSYANVDVSGTNRVGGISGKTSSDETFELNNVESYGDITSTDLHSGGIVGQVSGEENIINSYSTGEIYAEEYKAAGITGYTNGDIINTHSDSTIVINQETNRGSSVSGGLVGVLKEGSKIENSSATGDVNSIMRVNGGLVGLMERDTIVLNSFAEGDVKSESENNGGLVGEANEGTIINSYSTGNVIAKNRSGGLLGHGSSVTIDESFATGVVNVSSSTGGGLVGRLYSDSEVTNSYALGDVIVDDGSGTYAGGLVAFVYEQSVIEKSYSTGEVSASGDEVGGLIGEVSDDGDADAIDVIQSYWNTETTDQDNAIGIGSELTSGPIIGLNTNEMQGSDAEDNMDELDFVDVWMVVEDRDDYPDLQWNE